LHGWHKRPATVQTTPGAKQAAATHLCPCPANRSDSIPKHSACHKGEEGFGADAPLGCLAGTAHEAEVAELPSRMGVYTVRATNARVNGTL
jgi:hypothetical protein